VLCSIAAKSVHRAAFARAFIASKLASAGMLAALAFAPVAEAVPVTCDTVASDCQINYNRTYTDPNTYDYRSYGALDLYSVGGGSPKITQTGGTVYAKQLFLSGSVSYDMSGGTANFSDVGPNNYGDVIVDLDSGGSSTAYFTQSGGTVNAGGNLRLARFNSNVGVYTLSGGNVNVSGTVNLVDGSAINAKAYFYLNGGTLTANEIHRDGFNGQQTTAEFHFNGGTLRAVGNADNANWINFNNGWFQLFDITYLALDAGGAIFDTNGRNMGIQQPLPASWNQGSESPSSPYTSGGVTKRGAGTLTLSAGNAYGGNTTVEAGTLILANTNATVNSTVVLNGGSLSFSTITNATLGGLGGSQNFTLQNTGGTAVTLAVGNNGANTTYSGAMSGTGSLNKIGGGTLILSGTNTYTGTTGVSSGTLRVNGAVGAGALGVAANATLGGSGSVNGAATIQNGGHLAPGNSPGTLTFTNGLSLNGGAILDLELGTASDLVRVSGGTLGTAGVTTINVTDSGGFGYGNYTLIDFTGATAGGVGASNFALGTKPAGNYLYALSVQGTKLMLGVTPPPPTVTSVSGPAAGLYGIGKPLDFTVHFDKAVTVTGAPRLVLTLPGFGAQYANYVSGSGTADLVFRYTVTSGIPNNMSGITLAGSIDLNGGGLVDVSSTAALLTLNGAPSLATITLDGTVPTPTSILLAGTPPPTSLTISYTVVFSESVTGVSASAFTVVTGDGTATGQVGTIGGSGNTYAVAVTRVGGVGHLFLALKSSGTGITDLAGNAISGGLQGNQFLANLQRRCYVSKAAAGANDGSSWTDAYTDLQFAVRDIGCVEIWTAKGVYKPGSAKTDSFQPLAGVKLYGGFAGSETALAQRTPDVIAANPTVMSGDIDNNDATDANGVVLDAGQIAGSNSTNVVMMNKAGAAGYGADTVIDGFIITAGDAGSGGNGGGLICNASALQPTCNFTLSNLVFSGNRGGGGGALSLSSSSNGTANATVSKTLFRGNRAIGFGASGGAVFLGAPAATGRTSPAFSNVVFSGNSSQNWGGAIDLNVNLGTVTSTFDNITFSGNVSSALRGGAIASQAFGGGTARPTLRNAILWDGTDPEIVLDGSGAAVLDYAVVQGGCPGGSTCTNLISGNPNLLALGNYGGAVPTLTLGSGSVAIDSGTCTLADDMRFVSRPQGAGCEVGAVELRRPVLTATISGGGTVSASATPVPLGGGIANCSSTCTAMYDGEALPTPTVTLTATPNAQQSFSAWSGDCSGSNPVTTVTMTAMKNCTATFVPNVALTTLTLTAGTNPSEYDTDTTFTATVTAIPPATQAPADGSLVFFYDGPTLITTKRLAGGTATFTSSTLLNVGTHSLTALFMGDDSGGDPNYAAAAQVPSAALSQTVTPASLTLTWSAPSAIVYGTQLDATQLNATATHRGNPVSGTFIYTPPAGTMLPAGLGQTLSVTFTPIDTTNYIGATASVLIDVARAPLSVIGTGAQNKPYDGNTTATLSGGTLVGVLPADAGNVTLTQAGSFAQSNVGTGIAVTANDSIAGGAVANYTLSQPTGLSANITAVVLTYQATPATISYGTTPSGLTGTVTGFVNGESQNTATTGTLSFTTTATASSAVGSYPIDGSGLSANHGNYTFTQAAGNATALTITSASSTTTLSAPATAVYGQSVTLAASVSLSSGTAMPAGTVTFTESGNPLPGGCSGAATVASGIASCTTSTLAVSTHQVLATFTPSDGNATGSSASASISVSPASTTTTITNAQPWTLTLGASTTVNVSVSANANEPGSGTPTGSVTVSDGASQCTIAALSGGAGSCTLTPSSAGNKTVTATYTPEAAASTNFTGSSATAPLTVNPAQPGSTLISSSNPSVFGQAVALTGTVTPATGGVAPTGKVHFFIDGTTEICVDAPLSATGTANAVRATCSIPQADLSVGDHPVQFQYDGDANNTASTATLMDVTNNKTPQTVSVAQTTTVITAPASIVLGSPVTIGVSVSANAPGAGIPSGEVAVSLGSLNCNVTLDAAGTGNCTFTPPAPAGSKTITANYAGSTDFAASSANAALQVATAATTTTLTANPTTSVYGQGVAFTAVVSVSEGIQLNGALAFRNGAVDLPGCGAVPVVSGSAQCTTTSLPVGAQTIAATFASSDGNTAGSSATTGVTVAKAATTTTLSATSPITLGNPVTVNAAVSVNAPGAGTLTGTIAIGDGDSAAGDHCTITLPATSCTLTPSAAGSKTLTATYTPDTAAGASFSGSSATTSLVVNPAQPGTNLISSVNPSVFGQSITFTATVTPASGGVVPTGSVTFNDGGTSLCAAVALVAGSGNAAATCVTSTLSVAGHTISVRYPGDANNQASTATLNQVVNKADQTLTFPAQTTPSRVFATNATFAIAPLATSAEPNSGQPIVYTSATAAVCSVSGTTVTMLATGTCTIAANQAGDGNYNAAAEVRQSIEITSAASAITLAASTTTPAVDDPVTLTATVNGQAPTGTVTITDGSTVLCDRIALTANGDTATASCTTSFATAGSRTLTANYAGDANNAAQNSAPLAVQVGLKCSAMALAATPSRLTAGQNLSLAATLSGCTRPTGSTGAASAANASNAETGTMAAAAAMPTGTVTFREGSATLGSGTIDGSGIATLTLSPSRPGTHVFDAVYAGDRAFAPAQAQVTVVVDPSAAPPVPAPALDGRALWLLAVMLSLVGIAVRRRQMR
jgi:autotransporter-associated beta strand protein/predicted outer membrane repeat protein